ncbi:MAG: Bcr/CflA family drug resistance efflux transporter, partial [Planctomycetes bacterium]|nr:Bcr/CflA family drug resistance efflux transporter [Planctomycetota bacterium]
MARPEDGRFPLPLIILLGALGTIGPLSIDMYLPALPTIGLELGGDAGAAQHSLAAYFAGLAVGGLAIGPLSDRFG